MTGKIWIGANRALTAALIAGAGVAATPALAQASGVVPGMQVVDQAGNPVGTIASMKGGNVVLNTGTHQVAVPASSFAVSKGKLLFGMTKAQVDAAAEQASAKAAAAVVPGANVYGKNGALAGTIDSIDADYATIKLTTGEKIRIPRSGIGGAPNGNGAMIGVTVEQLKQTAAQAQNAQPSSSDSTGKSTS